jgi:DnaK suppressor protein
MARRDALLRLHKTLVSRRDELRRRLGGEYLRDLRSRGGESLGDAADMAFGTAGDEVNSQLAALESRELSHIELAIQKLKAGTYGLCEGCGKRIPVARLNALPFSTMCIECQRELETYGHLDRRAGGNWEKVSDSSFEEAKEINIADLEMDLSHHR